MTNSPGCSTRCVESAYVIYNEDRSAATALYAFFESVGERSKPAHGSVQLPVAAVIVVRTIRDDRKETVLAAIRQLNRGGNFFLRAFLDRKATVVKKLGPRKYKVILMYKEAYL